MCCSQGRRRGRRLQRCSALRWGSLAGEGHRLCEFLSRGLRDRCGKHLSSAEHGACRIVSSSVRLSAEACASFVALHGYGRLSSGQYWTILGVRIHSYMARVLALLPGLVARYLRGMLFDGPCKGREVARGAPGPCHSQDAGLSCPARNYTTVEARELPNAAHVISRMRPILQCMLRTNHWQTITLRCASLCACARVVSRSRLGVCLKARLRVS